MSYRLSAVECQPLSIINESCAGYVFRTLLVIPLVLYILPVSGLGVKKENQLFDVNIRKVYTISKAHIQQMNFIITE